ncbi:hypothetical protein HXX76_009093 [Chlamydomonas incerta]|uniref:Protein kinase domain-containing protein n=1 Tax=Chlamydomonas incerta TaxID=51695 RepID=A0A835SS74_CHLIN|nr:hypothetical protein HXX76_009093 [Chlamydomonas incerta]|eukprot:KAG2432173.1 hypothetical protein HXX76_009093 [Chlamydomonas incerta]
MWQGTPPALQTVDLRSLSGLFSVPPNGTLELRGLSIVGAALPAAPFPLPAAGFLALSAFRLGAGARLRLVDCVLTVPSCGLLSLHQTYACRVSPSPNVTVTPSGLVVRRLTTPSLDADNVTVQCTGAAAPFPCLATSVDGGTELVQAIFAAQPHIVAGFSTFGLSEVPVYLFVTQDTALAEAAPLFDTLCRASRASSSDGAFGATAGGNATLGGEAAADTGMPQPTAAPPPAGPTVWAGCSAPLQYRLVLSGAAGAATVLDLAGTTSWVQPGQRTGGLELRSLTLRGLPAGPAEAVPLALMRLLVWTADFPRRNLGRRSRTYLALRDCGVELPAAEVAMWRQAWGLPLSPRLQAALCLQNDETVLGDVVAEQAPGSDDDVMLLTATGWADASVFTNVRLVVREEHVQPPPGSPADVGAAAATGTATTGPLAAPWAVGDFSSFLQQQPVADAPGPAYPALCIIVTPAATPPMSSRAYRRVSTGTLTGNDLVGITAGIDNSTSETTRVPLEQAPFANLIASYSRGVDMRLNTSDVAGKIRVFAPVMLLGDFYGAVELDVDGQVAAVSIAGPVKGLLTLRRIALTSLPRACCGGAEGVSLAAAARAAVPPPAGSQPRRSLGHSSWGVHSWRRELRQEAAATADVSSASQPPDGITQGLAPALANFTSCLWTFEFGRSPAALAADVAGGAGGRPAGLPRLFLDGVVLVLPEAELQLLGRVWAVSADLLSGRLAFSADTDPGLAAALRAMLEGSVLGDGGSSSSPNSSTATLQFSRLQWCGYVGRNVTLTSHWYSASAAASLRRVAATWTSPSDLLPLVQMAALVPHAPPQTAMHPSSSNSSSSSVAGSSSSSSRGGTSSTAVTVAVPVVAAVIGAAALLAAVALVWAWRRRTQLRSAAGSPRKEQPELSSRSTRTPRSTNSGYTAGGAAAATTGPDSGLTIKDSSMGSGVGVATVTVAATAASADNRPVANQPRPQPSRTWAWALITGRSSKGGRGGRNSQRRSPSSTASGAVNDAIRRISCGVAPRTASGTGSGGAGSSGGAGAGGDGRSSQADGGRLGSSDSSRRQRASPSAAPGGQQESVRKAIVGMLMAMGETQASEEDVGGAAASKAASSAQAAAWTQAACPGAPGTGAREEHAPALRPRSRTTDGFLRPTAVAAAGAIDGAGAASPHQASPPPPLLAITGELGRGAQGVVYRGLWRGLDVAVKSVLFHLEQGPGGDISAQQAVQEAAIAVSMAHPNIVATYTYQLQPLHIQAPRTYSGQAEAEVWKLTLIQELCDASSLRHCLQSGPLLGSQAGAGAGAGGGDQQPPALQPLAARTALLLACDIARGLAHLHERGVVHADLSSNNVLLQSTVGRPPRMSAPGAAGGGLPATSSAVDMGVGFVAKLCDFGMSGRLDVEADATHLSGPARRSSAYSAPELVAHGRSGPAGDVYAFAVVLWELALGLPLPAALARPESAGLSAWLSEQARLVPLGDDVLEEDGAGSQAPGPAMASLALPPSLLWWPPGTPPGLVAVVAECLRPEPRSRPSAAALLQRLRRLAENLDPRSSRAGSFPAQLPAAALWTSRQQLEPTSDCVDASSVLQGPECGSAGGLAPQQPAVLDLRSLSGLFSVPPNGTLELRGLSIVGAALPAAPFPLPAAGFLALSAFRLGAGARLRLVDCVLTVPSCALLSLHQTYACGVSPSPNVTVMPSGLLVRRLTTPSLDADNVTVQCTGAAAPFPCLAASVRSGTELLAAVYGAFEHVSASSSLFGRTDPPVYLHIAQHVVLAEAAAVRDGLCPTGSRASASADAGGLAGRSPAPATGPSPAMGTTAGANGTAAAGTAAGCTPELSFRLVLSGDPGAATVLDLAGTSSWLKPKPGAGLVELRHLTLRNAPAGPTGFVPLSLMRLYIWTVDFTRYNVGYKYREVLTVSDCGVELPAAEVAMWRQAWGLPLSPRLQAALCLLDNENVLGDAVTQQVPGSEEDVFVVSVVGWSDRQRFSNVRLVVVEPAAAAVTAAAATTAGTASGAAPAAASSTALDAAAGTADATGAGTAAAAGPSDASETPAASTQSDSSSSSSSGGSGSGSMANTLLQPWAAATAEGSTGSMATAAAAAGYPSLCAVVPPGADPPLSSRSYRALFTSSLASQDLLSITGGIDISTSETTRVPLVSRGFGYEVFTLSRPVNMRLNVSDTAVGKVRVFAPVMLLGDFYGAVELDVDGQVAAVSIAGPVKGLLTLRRIALTGLPRACCGGAEGVSLAAATQAAVPPPAGSQPRRSLGHSSWGVHNWRRELRQEAAATADNVSSASQPPDGITQGLAPALANFTSCLWTFEFGRSPEALAADAAGGAAGRPAGLPRLFLDGVALVLPEAELQLLGRVWAASADLLSGRLAFSADTDPGLAAALRAMLEGSVLGDGGSSSSPNSSTATLQFSRLQWCGYVGRNVTLTSHWYSASAAASLRRVAATWTSPWDLLPLVQMAALVPHAPPAPPPTSAMPAAALDAPGGAALPAAAPPTLLGARAAAAAACTAHLGGCVPSRISGRLGQSSSAASTDAAIVNDVSHDDASGMSLVTGPGSGAADTRSGAVAAAGRGSGGQCRPGGDRGNGSAAASHQQPPCAPRRDPVRQAVISMMVAMEGQQLASQVEHAGCEPTASGGLSTSIAETRLDLPSSQTQHESRSWQLADPDPEGGCVATGAGVQGPVMGAAGPAGHSAPPPPLAITGELGRGAQGAVYRGLWRGLDVAVKSVLFQQTEGPGGDISAQQAVQEAAIAVSMAHPNIVATYTYQLQPLHTPPQQQQTSWVEGSGAISRIASSDSPSQETRASALLHRTGEAEVWKLTLIQELCDASSLRHCLQSGRLLGPQGGADAISSDRQAAVTSGSTGALAAAAALAAASWAPPLQTMVARTALLLACDIARGLAHLHERGVVHADLSSNNVLLQSKRSAATAFAPDGGLGVVAKLCDFGMSGRLDVEADATHLSGPARRSSAYSAPELVAHGRSGPAGDVYAFAVVLWELALGLPLPAALARPESAGLSAWLSEQARLVPLGDDVLEEEGTGSQAPGPALASLALPSGLLWWPPGTPPGLVALVAECLRPEPRSRPSAAVLLQRLQQLLQTADKHDLITDIQTRIHARFARVALRSWVGGVPCEPGQYYVPFEVQLPEHLTPTFAFSEDGSSTSAKRHLKASVSYHLEASITNQLTERSSRADRPSGSGLRASALNASASLRALGRALSSKRRSGAAGSSPPGSRKSMVMARLPSLAAADAHARLDIAIQPAPPPAPEAGAAAGPSTSAAPPPQPLAAAGSDARPRQPVVVEEVIPVFTLSDTCVCYMSDSGSVKLRLELDKHLVQPGEVLEVVMEADGSKSHMAFPKLILEAGILVQLHDRHAAGDTAAAADFTPLLRHELTGLYPSHLARLMEKLSGGGAGGSGSKSKASSRFSMRMPADLGPSVRGQLITRCLAVRLIASPDEKDVLAAARPTAVARVWLDAPPPRSVDPAGVLVQVA